MSQKLTTLRRSEVPEYLHNSAFYLSFNDEADDDEISVPIDCVKANLTVNTLKDIEHLLRTMRFWVLITFPEEFIDVLVRTDNFNTTEISAILQEFEPAFPGINALVSELRVGEFRNHRLIECEVAAKHGRVDFLEHFLRLQFLIPRIGKRALREAAAHGHLPCVKYLYNFMCTHGNPRPLRGMNLQHVIEKGHVECLQFLVQHGVWVDDGLCVRAIQWRQIACLDYLLEATGTRHEYFTNTAVERGDSCMLQCVLKHGCEVTEKAWLLAAIASTADCFAHLLDAFPATIQSDEMLTKLVAQAHEPALHALLLRGYPFSPNSITDAARQGNMQCLQFLHQHCGFDCYTPSTMATAAAAGQLDLLIDFYQEQGCLWDDTAPIAALRENQPVCLQFFVEERGIPQTAEFRAIAPSQQCLQVLRNYESRIALKAKKEDAQGRAEPVLDNASGKKKKKAMLDHIVQWWFKKP